MPHRVAAPRALIGTSNALERLVAVAIGLVGLDSGTAPATVVGVRVEVPVMLSPVAFAGGLCQPHPRQLPGMHGPAAVVHNRG